MTYEYKCTNENCILYDVVVEIQKPLKDSSKKEYCKECRNELKRIYKFGCKTSDGVKI